MLHLVLSRHELASGRPDHGERHAESAAALDPGNAEALIHLSSLRLQQSRSREALELLSRAESIASGVAGVDELRARIVAGGGTDP